MSAIARAQLPPSSPHFQMRSQNSPKYNRGRGRHGHIRLPIFDFEMTARSGTGTVLGSESGTGPSSAPIPVVIELEDTIKEVSELKVRVHPYATLWLRLLNCTYHRKAFDRTSLSSHAPPFMRASIMMATHTLIQTLTRILINLMVLS